jgi:hypothetical protein
MRQFICLLAVAAILGTVSGVYMTKCLRADSKEWVVQLTDGSGNHVQLFY